MKKKTNFIDWYNYGFDTIVEQATGNMKRQAAINFICDEVATFAKCDPNFKASDRAGDPSFVFNFSMYLVGRYDQRIEDLATAKAMPPASKTRGNLAKDMQPKHPRGNLAKDMKQANSSTNN